jgi:polar amino acid transport system substrate-binding protein
MNTILYLVYISKKQKKEKTMIKKIMFVLVLLMSILKADELQDKLNKLTIIAEAGYPPITFKNKSGQPDGLAVEVAKRIMKNLHINKRINVWPWARGYTMLEKKPNVVLFSVSRTAQRDKKFQWVGPIYSMKSIFYVRSNSNIQINSLEDAKKLRKIGTYRDSFNEQYLKEKGFTNLEAVKDNIINVKKLMNKRIDAMTATNVTIKDILKKANYSLKDVKPAYTFMNVGVYFAFSKDVPFEVVDAWRKELEKLRSSCELQKIRNKWLK